MLALLLSVHLASTSNVPGAVEAMNFVRDDIKPVIQFAMNWAGTVALCATSTHAFIVLCKRFLDS
jgi:hypothetical protein